MVSMRLSHRSSHEVGLFLIEALLNTGTRDMGVVQIIFSPSDYSPSDNVSAFTCLDSVKEAALFPFPFSKELFMWDMNYAWVQTFCTVTCNLDLIQVIRHFSHVKIEG